MKTFTAFIVILGAVVYADELHCTEGIIDISKNVSDMVQPCVHKMQAQIQKEVNAAVQYLAMGAHFSRDTINRPGFAHHFFEAASEEREHAQKLISYLLMRGELTSNVTTLITINVPEKMEWNSGVDALKFALQMEQNVTKSIREVIIHCEDPKQAKENFNDYHLVDYLTGEFLEEQYKGQRELAGKISQLQKMMAKHGALGEFLFDKKLL